LEVREFTAELKLGTVRPFYLFHGEEQYAAEKTLRHLYNTVQPENSEADRETLEEGVTGAAVKASCQALPWIAKYRLVTVRGEGVWKWKADSSDLNHIKSYIESPNSSCVLVFYCRGRADARTALYKLLKPGEVHCEPLSPGEASAWLQRQAKARGGEIQRGAAQLLVESAGCDLWTLHNELDKLLAYAGANPISEPDVKQIATHSVTYKVYNIIDALAEGRRAQAATLLATALAEREEPIYLLAAMARQFHQLLCARMSPGADLESLLGVRGFVLTKIKKQAARFTPEQLQGIVTKLAELDVAIKSGKGRDAGAALEGCVGSVI